MGLTLPNNKNLKAIASLGGISVFKLLYGNPSKFLFDHFDEIMSGKYSTLKEAIPLTVTMHWCMKLEKEILSPTDFDNIRRIIEEDFEKVERGKQSIR